MPTCGPYAHTATDLKASAVKVVALSPTRERIFLAKTDTATGVMAFHEDALAQHNSPHLDGPGSYEYWYTSDIWVDHEWSNPCSNQDEYGFGTQSFCWGQIPGSQLHSGPCNFDVISGLQKLVAGTWTAPWGYKRFTRSYTTAPCFGSGDPHLVPDQVNVRTWTSIKVKFFFYPTLTDSAFSQRRKVSTKSVSVDGLNHSITSNGGSGGYVLDTNPPTPVGTFNCN